SISEVVPGNVHIAVVRRSWVVVDPARLSVVAAPRVNAEMGPAIRVPRRAGPVPAQTLTAAGRVEPDGEPNAAFAVVHNNRVAKGIVEGACTGARGEADEGVATVGGDRCAGD